MKLLFADDFVLLADSADGLIPLLSDSLLDALEAGRRMELRFDLLQEAAGDNTAVDGMAAFDLQAGRGGAAVAAVRRCTGDESTPLATASHSH